MLARLCRQTSSGRFIPEIDGLRFIAIGLVVLYHLQGVVAGRLGLNDAEVSSDWLLRIGQHGDRGVQLFFAISGFILGLPFAAHRLAGGPRVNLRQYFWRRVTRLEPPYFVSMLLVFAGAVLIGGRSATALAPHLAASLAYLHNAIYGVASTVNGVAWSLEIEVQFYILVPALAALFAVRGRLPRRALVAALAVALMTAQWYTLSPYGPQRLALSIYAAAQYFLVGFLLADVYVVDWGMRPRSEWRWDLVSLVGWPLAWWLWRDRWLPHLFFPGVIFILYCAAFRGVAVRAFLRNRWIATIGGMCYTIYLLHFAVIAAFERVLAWVPSTGRPSGDLVVHALLVLPPLLVVCAGFFALVERPCMDKDWPRRLKAWAWALRTRRVAGPAAEA